VQVSEIILYIQLITHCRTGLQLALQNSWMHMRNVFLENRLLGHQRNIEGTVFFQRQYLMSWRRLMSFNLKVDSMATLLILEEQQ
jgi:hypothetical protein